MAISVIKRTTKWIGIILAFIALMAAIALSGGIYQVTSAGDYVVITNRFTGETWSYLQDPQQSAEGTYKWRIR